MMKMKKLKKISALLTSFTLASTMFGCTPTIGSGTQEAMNAENYSVRAGIFIYYTLQAYNDAVSVLQEQGVESPTLDDVKKARIDEVDSSDWIQNKATEYCQQYLSILKEADNVGIVLTDEELEEAESMGNYYYSMNTLYDENGIGEQTMKEIAESTYKEEDIFKYYYGFDGEKGCTEEELKDYFDENFARVKYFTIDLTNDEGELVDEDQQRELRKKAEDYAKQINKKSDELDKMWEVDKVSEDYDEYKESLVTTTAAEGEETETTTTTTTVETEEETETTTTDPYANENLIQKQTTTVASDESEETQTTTTEDDATRASREFNEYVFNELPLNEAQVYDYDEDTIYVIVRGDLRERMTEDDYWSQDYIDQLLQLRYYDEFSDYMQGLADQIVIDKNNASYRRYAPFKLKLESEESQ